MRITYGTMMEVGKYLLPVSISLNVAFVAIIVAIIVIIQWELVGGLPYIKRSTCRRNCNKELWKANMLRVNQVNGVSYKCGCSDGNLTWLKDRNILCADRSNKIRACRYTMDALLEKDG